MSLQTRLRADSTRVSILNSKCKDKAEIQLQLRAAALTLADSWYDRGQARLSKKAVELRSQELLWVVMIEVASLLAKPGRAIEPRAVIQLCVTYDLRSILRRSRRAEMSPCPTGWWPACSR